MHLLEYVFLSDKWPDRASRSLGPLLDVCGPGVPNVQCDETYIYWTLQVMPQHQK